MGSSGGNGQRRKKLILLFAISLMKLKVVIHVEIFPKWYYEYGFGYLSAYITRPISRLIM